MEERIQERLPLLQRGSRQLDKATKDSASTGVLGRVEISRVTIGGISSPELKGAQGLVCFFHT